MRHLRTLKDGDYKAVYTELTENSFFKGYVLFSYGLAVVGIERTSQGLRAVRFCDKSEISNTTAKHIKAFSLKFGVSFNNKQQKFDDLPCVGELIL